MRVGAKPLAQRLEFKARGASLPDEILEEYFEALLAAFGPQGWWPARTRMEVILGAILTQRTAWTNAVLALRRLKRAKLLTWQALRRASLDDLQSCIRPAGFFQQKARTIQGFIKWLDDRYGGKLNVFFSRPGAELRSELLALEGLGPETADAILLYAGKKPFFVADAYTRRVLARHGWIPASADYAQAQGFLHQYLPARSELLNEFHALLVETGKRYCRVRVALCDRCPLGPFMNTEPVPAQAAPAARMQSFRAAEYATREGV